MSLPINTDCAFRTDDERRQLVEAVLNTPGDHESHWLEYKSTLDFTTASGPFALARNIIGFANRSVEQANLVCEGVAYILVGVEPGNALGVPRFDPADLSNKLAPWVDGPRYDCYYVDVQGVSFLVVVIESPRLGDPIHTLQKSYGGQDVKGTVAAGSAYHRPGGKTLPADPKAMEMLQERLLARLQKPVLDLDLAASCDPLTRLELKETDAREWFSAHERHIRANSGRPPDPPAPEPDPLYSHLPQPNQWIQNMLGGPQYFTEEDEQDFERDVRKHMKRAWQSVAIHLVRMIVRSSRNKVTIVARNNTDDPVSDIQLSVFIPGTNLLVFTSPPPAKKKAFPIDLPTWPEQTHIGLTTRALTPAAFDRKKKKTRDSVPVSKVDGGYQMDWEIGNLRPHQPSEARSFTVIARPETTAEIEVVLTARAMDRRGTVTKSETLRVAAESWTIGSVLQISGQSAL